MTDHVSSAPVLPLEIACVHCRYSLESMPLALQMRCPECGRLNYPLLKLEPASHISEQLPPKPPPSLAIAGLVLGLVSLAFPPLLVIAVPLSVIARPWKSPTAQAACAVCVTVIVLWGIAFIRF